MIPLKDDIRSYSLPIVTYIILGLNILIFIYEVSLGAQLDSFIRQFGVIPMHLFHPTSFFTYTTLFSSMFIHGSLMHIFGNMLFLWIFADNIEDRFGHTKFLLFYLLCGVAGALLQSIAAPNSTIPMVGASGAISGVLGAYVLLFPKARILALIPFGFFLRVSYLPSIIFLGIWFLYQFIFGISSIGARGGGVAYLAHIGGFVVGFLIALLFKKKEEIMNIRYCNKDIRLSEHQNEEHQIIRVSDFNFQLVSCYPGNHFLIPCYPDSLSYLTRKRCFWR